MLPKKHRLLSGYDFRWVGRWGRVYRDPFFNLAVAEAKQSSSPSRFGFVVSSRLDKRSTVRNKLKRVLREALHGRLSKISPGYDAVFYIRAAMKGKTYEEICLKLDQLLPKTPFVEKPSRRAALPYR